MKKIHAFDEVFDAQKLFRNILTAMSNPTKSINIQEYSDKLYGGAPDFLALALTLLDNEVGFYTGGDETLSSEIRSLTLGKKETLQDADFIFVSDTGTLRSVIKNAKCGTLRDPHKSATIIVRIDESKEAQLRLYGAGIDKIIEFQTSPIVKTALDIRDAQYYEYPQGVDFIFVSQGGELFCLPRLTLREVQ